MLDYQVKNIWPKVIKVSRPIVREALARLREDGVIHSRRGAGSFIIRIPQPLLNSNEKNMKDWMELLHCYEFRTVLEGNNCLPGCTTCYE